MMRHLLGIIPALAIVAGAQTVTLTQEEERQLLLSPKAIPTLRCVGCRCSQVIQRPDRPSTGPCRYGSGTISTSGRA